MGPGVTGGCVAAADGGGATVGSAALATAALLWVGPASSVGDAVELGSAVGVAGCGRGGWRHGRHAAGLDDEVNRQREHTHRHDDHEQPEKIADYPPPVAWSRRSDRPIYQALAVTIAVGHARIVTLTS